MVKNKLITAFSNKSFLTITVLLFVSVFFVQNFLGEQSSQDISNFEPISKHDLPDELKYRDSYDNIFTVNTTYKYSYITNKNTENEKTVIEYYTVVSISDDKKNAVIYYKRIDFNGTVLNEEVRDLPVLSSSMSLPYTNMYKFIDYISNIDVITNINLSTNGKLYKLVYDYYGDETKIFFNDEGIVLYVNQEYADFGGNTSEIKLISIEKKSDAFFTNLDFMMIFIAIPIFIYIRHK